jgi:hypothetical protein
MKDFDFQRPTQKTPSLSGHVMMPRDLAELTVFKRKPFDEGRALVDLWFVANRDSGSWKSDRGQVLEYQPGDVLWSAVGLADRWGWERHTVRKFLDVLKSAGIVELLKHPHGFIIRLLDYTTSSTTCPPTGQTTSDTTGPTTEGEGDSREIVGEREGGGVPPPVEKSFTEENVLSAARNWHGDGLLSIPSGIPDAWALRYFAWRQKTGAPENWTADLIARFRIDYTDPASPGHASARNAKNHAPEPAADPSDPDWFWTDPVSTLESALAAALKLGQTDTAKRLREVLAMRNQKKPATH